MDGELEKEEAAVFGDDESSLSHQSFVQNKQKISPQEEILEMENVSIEIPKEKLMNNLSQLNKQNICDWVKMEVKADVVTKSMKVKFEVASHRNQKLEEILKQKIAQENLINSKGQYESAGWVILEKEMNNTGLIKNTLTAEIENLEGALKFEIKEKNKLEDEIKHMFNSCHLYKNEVQNKSIRNEKTIKELSKYLEESRENYFKEIEDLKQQTTLIESSRADTRNKISAAKRKFEEMSLKRDKYKNEINDELIRQKTIENDINCIPLEELKQKQLIEDKEYQENINKHQQKLDNLSQSLETKLLELNEVRNTLKENDVNKEKLTDMSNDLKNSCIKIKQQYEELQKKYETNKACQEEMLSEIYTKQQKCNQLDMDINVVNQEMATLTTKHTQLNMQIQIASPKFNTLKITKEQLEIQINNNNQFFSKEKEIKDANLKDIKDQCEQLKDKISTTLNDMEAQKNKHICFIDECKKNFDSQINEANLQLEVLNQELSDTKTNAAQLLAKQTENTKNLENLVDELAFNKNNLKNKKDTIQSLSESRNKKILMRNSLADEYKKVQDQLAMKKKVTPNKAASTTISSNFDFNSPHAIQTIQSATRNTQQPTSILKSTSQIISTPKKVSFEPELKWDNFSDSSVEIGTNFTSNNKENESEDPFDTLFRSSPPVREKGVSINHFRFD